ncbi:MAG: MFS transporter [Nocardioides sp.]|uniref:MFS transporter n=1 Tax=Nocardioides sp. TaxID=35761 RepID=UPI0039E60167
MTTQTVRRTVESSAPAAGRHRRGFWMLAVAFAVLMSFTTVPTPMYPLYQARDGFPTVLITVIFAAYGIGVMAGLFLAGHLSDHLGRRPVLAAAVAAELVSVTVFILGEGVPALLVARFVCGFGIGALTSTATAALTELRAIAVPPEPRTVAATLASAVNLGGLAFGPLVGGLLVAWGHAPLRVPYLLYLVLLVAVMLVIATIPETVPERRRAAPYRYRPQQIQVEPHHRAEFAAAGVAAAAAFAVMGFYTSLTASFLRGTLGNDSPVIAGATVFGLMAASAVSQVALAGLAVRSKVYAGLVLMLAGLAGIAVAAQVPSLPGYVVGGVLAGAGVGLVFASAIEAAARLGRDGHRGEAIAGMFLAAYGGITVPVIASGVALIWWPATTVIGVFAGVVALTVVLAVGRMARQLPR